MLLSDLKKQAKELGVRGFSKMKKAELQQALETIRPSEQSRCAEPDTTSDVEPDIVPPVEVAPESKLDYNSLTNKQLRDEAKGKGLKGVSKLNKMQLIDRIVSIASV
jgi:hypothetical protein